MTSVLVRRCLGAARVLRALVPIAVGAWCCMDSQAAAETTAFFYSKPIPPELAAAYDQIVVEPGHGHDLAALAKAHAVPVAYLSIGEVAAHKLDKTKPAWRLVQNDAWASTVMDLNHPGYRSYVIDQYEKLWQQGYRRFFLDTLDSYQLGTQDKQRREQLRRALCDLIVTMAKRHPEARWLLNRGFELLPDIAKHVHGVVAESLFDRWDAANSRYVRVPKADREWLLARLNEAKDRYHLPVIVIDYRPPEEREQARVTAKKIAELGFEPWVCNGALSNLGVGSVEVMPRRVIVVTDKPHASRAPGPARFLLPVVEYLGYVPELHSIEQGLPDYELGAHVAGVISVLPPGADNPGYEAWLARQLGAGVRVVLFGGLGLRADGPVAASLGIRPVAAPEPGRGQAVKAAVVQRDALIGFEADPPAHDPEGVAVEVTGEGVTPHLVLRTGSGARATAIATTRFGGVALSHALGMRGLSGERAWVLDPFAFLQRALRLPEMPVPDVTTDSGRRVAVLAVDGRGLSDFARLRGRPRVANVLASQIVAKYPWPHALDLREPEASSAERARDVSAAQALLKKDSVHAEDVLLDPSAVGVPRSVTEVMPLWQADDPERVPLPIASDFAFIGDVPEAYPLRRVEQAWRFTGAPRRLRPIGLHYHAFALSSPGGLSAVSALYRALAEQGAHVLGFGEYRTRVAAFREQVITRGLDGSFAVVGGSALRTLRLPVSLGLPDLEHSEGVADVAEDEAGRYLSFTAAEGMRRVSFSHQPAPVLQISETHGAAGPLSALPETSRRCLLSPAPAQRDLCGEEHSLAIRTRGLGDPYLTPSEGHPDACVLRRSKERS